MEGRRSAAAFMLGDPLSGCDDRAVCSPAGEHCASTLRLLLPLNGSPNSERRATSEVLSEAESALKEAIHYVP